jgi:hypothetical protein
MVSFLEGLRNATRKALGMPRKKHQTKPNNVEDITPNKKNTVKNNKTLTKKEMNDAIKRMREGRIPSALVKDPKSRKPKRLVGFSNNNSEGNPLTTNKKNTRGLVPSLPRTITNTGYRLNHSKHMKNLSKKGPDTVENSTINKSYRNSNNTSPAPSYPKNLPMPNAELANLIAARRSFFYTPEEIKQMTPYNLVRLPKDHWRYAYNVIQGSNDSKKNEKLKAIYDRSSGAITNKQLNAENFPEGEE